MFSAEDFKIESFDDFAEFLLIAPFIGLVAPFMIAAYSLTFCMKAVGWLDT